MFLRKSRTPSADAVLRQLARDGGRGELAWSENLPAEAPVYAEWAVPLESALVQALAEMGIDRLYAHQAAAIEQIRTGSDVVIVTPTASGKTLAFNLPVLESLLTDPGGRALYVYPTNALVNDQARALQGLRGRIVGAPRAAVLTGATALEERRQLRAAPPQILLTNPEMLHLSLLGGHRHWSRFWRGLRFIVLDELHQYRGLFGGHMALVVRRALRIAALYGSSPAVIGCSATIGNPAELAAALTGRPANVVPGAGAARGPRTLAVWKPPLSRGAGDDERANAQTTAVDLFCSLIDAGLGVILFALTRRGAEEMSIAARARLGHELGSRVAPYRSGYSAEQRRRIEEGLKSGELLGVVATNALEVGIDIGGLDAAVLAGFPGSRSSFWQQAGRAGRGTRPALVAFVPYPRAVDGFYAAHPEQLLSGRFEDAPIDPANVRITAAHIACAAAEQPLTHAAAAALSVQSEQALELARADGHIVARRDVWHAAGADGHSQIRLRGSSGMNYRVVGPRGELGSLDEAHVYLEAHPGAVYLHEGERYRVTTLDPAGARVLVAPESANLMTTPRVETTVYVMNDAAGTRPGNGSQILHAGFGPLDVQQTTTAYSETQVGRRGASFTRLLDQPLTSRLQTTGCWLVFPDGVRRSLDGANPPCFADAVHGLEHLLPAAVALRILSDARDVVATYELYHERLGGAVLFLYDACAGGAGIAERAYACLADLLALCLTIVRDCPCRDGCPSCILSGSCWCSAQNVSKGAVRRLLDELMRSAAGGR